MFKNDHIVIDIFQNVLININIFQKQIFNFFTNINIFKNSFDILLILKCRYFLDI